MADARRPEFAVPVIVGPTASGKTALALALGRLIPIEIVSADSRQVYRRLDIGTAKPSRAEREAVPHHGLDLIGPTERYSAGRFAREASGWIAEIRARGRLPVVVGGTGFYIRALFEGLFDEPDLGPNRDGLAEALAELPPATLTTWARRLDPGFSGRGGRQRASRAIEVALLAGRPLSRLHAEHPTARPPVRPFHARLELPREQLAERIRKRAASMREAGLVEEVRGVLAAGVPEDAPGLTGVGYREVVGMLNGRLAEDQLDDLIAQNTRRYAKRQETWFRHQLGSPVAVLDGTRSPDALAQDVLSGYRAAFPDGA